MKTAAFSLIRQNEKMVVMKIIQARKNLSI